MDVRDLGNIDGVDMWKSLVENGESPRKEFVYNIDDMGDVYAALRVGDWKYITGTPSVYYLRSLAILLRNCPHVRARF